MNMEEVNTVYGAILAVKLKLVVTFREKTMQLVQNSLVELGQDLNINCDKYSS